MPKLRMTDRWVATVKAPPGTQVDYRDEVTRGLTLRVSQAGTKSWFAGIPVKGTGRRQRLPLGRYPTIGLEAARRATRDARERSELGEQIAPITPRAVLVRDLVERYLSQEQKANRSVHRQRLRMRRNILPIIGDVRIDQLHRRDVTACVDAVIERGRPVDAGHTFADLRGLLRWAFERGDTDGFLMLGMRAPPIAQPRERWLSAAELRWLWGAITASKLNDTSRNVIRLLAATGLRLNECAGLRLDEIDEARGQLMLAKERTKNKRDFTLPLSAFALDIIAAQRRVNEADAAARGAPLTAWLFPGLGRRAPLVGGSLTNFVTNRLQHPAAPNWRLHDLRRTMASHLAEMGVSELVIAVLLNHIGARKASVTTAHYLKYGFQKEAAEAAELWGQRLSAIVDGRALAEVVPLRRA